MSGLPREVLRWIQSLDLTWQIKTPKWDLTNGFLVAEIFSWYFPQDIQMHSYNNGTSLDSKMLNWSLLTNFITRKKLDIPNDLIDGTIHCKEGAGMLLICRIYEILTNRPAIIPKSELEADFTDRAYQDKLPLHARSTASQAVKNNLRITEELADKSIILTQQKSQCIINNHLDHRRTERNSNPDRFDIKPTLGERCPRRAPALSKHSTDITEVKTPTKSAANKEKSMPLMGSREPTVTFQEVEVKQLPSSTVKSPISGYS